TFGFGTVFGPAAEERKRHEEEATGRFVPEAPAKPASCPSASQIGSVEVFTPLLSGAPTIEGPPGKGSVGGDSGRLKCSSGEWSHGPWSVTAQQSEPGVEELENGDHEKLKISYRWLRNGAPIPAKASGREYTAVPEEDKGQALQCQVTARNEA